MTPGTALEETFRNEYGFVLASLVRTFGDFDLAEEALSEAIATACEDWPVSGVPQRPAAWLLTVGRRKAVDRIRSQERFHRKAHLLVAEEAVVEQMPDDRLRLIFACCHIALAPQTRLTLTLKALGGLSVPEIARALLIEEATVRQRLTRAKAKIRMARIPIDVPSPAVLEERLSLVLAVIYLIFNEGYSARSGPDLNRVDLTVEAIRLAEMMTVLMPTQSEVWALAALLSLTDARRSARVDDGGELVLLEAQDRSRWDRAAIDRGLTALEIARSRTDAGPYLCQAEIAAIHVLASTHSQTDWRQIIAQYERLHDLQPSPVVALNLAAAVAMADGPNAGLAMMEDLAESLDNYQPFHAARAELLARSGRREASIAGFRRALEFQCNDVERRHLTRRLSDLTGWGQPG